MAGGAAHENKPGKDIERVEASAAVVTKRKQLPDKKALPDAANSSRDRVPAP